MEQTPIQNPIPSTTPSAPLMLPVKKSGGALLKIIGLVAAVVLIAGGVVLATRVWDPSWSPLRPNPQTILEQALSKMNAWKTVKADIVLGFDMEDELQGSATKVAVGVISSSDKENSKAKASFDVSVDVKVPDASQSFIAKIGIDSIVSGADAYMNLKKAELPPMVTFLAAMGGFDISAMQNQWIKIDQSSLPAGITPGITQGQNGLSPDQQLQMTQITAELQKIISEANLVKSIQQLSDETINGQKAYHYVVLIDNEAMKEVMSKFLLKIPSILSMAGAPVQNNSSEDIQRINTQIGEFVDRVGGITYEVFIGKTDGEIYRVKGEKEIDASQLDEGQKGKLAISVDINYSDINKVVDVLAPASFKTLQEILTPSTGKL